VRTSARRSTIVALAVLLGASALALPQLALSQEDDAPAVDAAGLVENLTGDTVEAELAATPAEGPTGTRIQISGDGCVLPGTTLSADAVLASLNAVDGTPLFQAQLGVAADGSWQGELAAPAGTPAGELQATARCVDVEMDVVHYGPATFTVTGEGAADATATLPPTDTVPAPDQGLALAEPGSSPGLPGGGAAPSGEAGSDASGSEQASGAAGLPTFPNPAAAIEPLPAYDGQTHCFGARPGTISFQQLVHGVFPSVGLGNIERACGSGGQSEHKEGRAWDWMANTANATQYGYATQVIDWLLATDSRGNAYANARRLGIMYIIYNRSVFKLYRAEQGWQPYSGSSPHTDHVHFSLTRAGGERYTSWWTAPQDPCQGYTYEPFCDVGPDHQFGSQILWVADQGIANGYDDTSFRPLDPVSRQAMAAFIYRLSGAPTYSPPSNPTYSDVGTNHTFRREIEWLKARGIGTGYEDGTFRPLVSVSRQAMAAFLFRTAGSPAGYRAPTTSEFRDVAPGRPFYREIHWLDSEAISTGYSDGTFQPDANVSRQAMAAFLQRYDTNV
jgi:hypothetical protein